jgi:hypothetical protein
MTTNPYKDNADCNTREEYLKMLSDEYDIDEETVNFIADILGETEDFDGLVTALEDYQEDEGFF